MKNTRVQSYQIVEAISISEYQKTLAATNDYTELTVCNTSKRRLKCLYHFRAVYHASKRLLMIRKSIKIRKTEINYSLGNADLVQYTPEAITYMQTHRFSIEHAFKETKPVLGMHQFQTRKWIAWYHQIVLNKRLLLFIFREKLFSFKQLLLLLAWDIKQIMQFLIFTIFTDIDNRFDQILKRHQIRKNNINRYYSIS